MHVETGKGWIICITMLSDGIRDNDGAVEVKDIAEILDEATE